MNNLISINKKFMDISPSKLVELILNSKYTKGVEIYVDYTFDKELEYLKNLVLELKKNNLILQVHANTNLSFEKQKEYLKIIEEYSDYLGYKIVVTFHSIYDKDKKMSIKKTVEYLENIINYIDNNKIIISLENLNNTSELIRLGKDDIIPVILNKEKLFFTYDIGHEIVEYGKITGINKDIIKKVKNIHIHTFNDKGEDHFPIYKNDLNLSHIIKAINLLKNNKYYNNIVYEYNLYVCNGKNIQEKIIDYLNSIDFITENYLN